LIDYSNSFLEDLMDIISSCCLALGEAVHLLSIGSFLKYLQQASFILPLDEKPTFSFYKGLSKKHYFQDYFHIVQ
jgi:hypothetical protein